MGKLGKALILPEGLGTFKNQVYRIGIELEGAWAKVPRGTKIIRDGSVTFRPGDFGPEGPSANLQIGELPSPPLELEAYPGWLKTYFPTHINATCGMHVHLSFRTALQYQRLMDPKYPATIVAYVRKWAEREGLPPENPIWPRLKGESRYCQHLFHADQQVKFQDKTFNQDQPGHRYTVINYCYSRYTTLECRLLPMFPTAKQAQSAIDELVSITNAFLKTDRTREVGVRSEITVTGGGIKEETRINL